MRSTKSYIFSRPAYLLSNHTHTTKTRIMIILAKHLLGVFLRWSSSDAVTWSNCLIRLDQTIAHFLSQWLHYHHNKIGLYPHHYHHLFYWSYSLHKFKFKFWWETKPFAKTVGQKLCNLDIVRGWGAGLHKLWYVLISWADRGSCAHKCVCWNF